MRDCDCINFLQWALPKLGMRWVGFRKVRRQVCRRVHLRITELHLSGIGPYRDFLGSHRSEWLILDQMCRITISRFYRDQSVFAVLADTVLPALAVLVQRRKEKVLRCWSVGCCSGEEPYTLALIWNYAVPPEVKSDIRLEVIGSDVNPALLLRAREAFFSKSSLKELPQSLQEQAFTRQKNGFQLQSSVCKHVAFICHDIRNPPPFSQAFDLILSRNLAFTYFDEQVQREILGFLHQALMPGGALVIGCHESLPNHEVPLDLWMQHERVFRNLA